jgi:hypothetical protein
MTKFEFLAEYGLVIRRCPANEITVAHWVLNMGNGDVVTGKTLKKTVKKAAKLLEVTLTKRKV